MRDADDDEDCNVNGRTTTDIYRIFLFFRNPHGMQFGKRANAWANDGSSSSQASEQPARPGSGIWAGEKRMVGYKHDEVKRKQFFISFSFNKWHCVNKHNVYYLPFSCHVNSMPFGMFIFCFQDKETRQKPIYMILLLFPQKKRINFGLFCFPTKYEYCILR